MQPSSIVSGVPFFQNPRRGQREAFEQREILQGQGLNIKLPTGYGKTFTACGIYSIRQHHHLATRLLYVVPSKGQLDQFIGCGPQNLGKTSVEGPRGVIDIGFHTETDVFRRHRSNRNQVFATTIQYLTQGGFNTCKDLMETGQWMLVIDEYHHYGVDKTWGQRIKQLSHSFLLAMSATPYRPKEDSAFGSPNVAVTYRDACEELAVKPLVGHAYDYRIDAVDDDSGEIKTFSTRELAKEAGSDSPDNIERFRIAKKMRWSPKYVSPLVRVPIERMQQQRTETGQFLQVLVTAMCVSHAELVCSQLRGMYPELNIDWVGTGDFGRSDDANAEIIEKFCPTEPSDPLKRRPLPTLDVLVHVGMAGEGLDAIHVSEIVLLRPASLNNHTMQIIGRGSRYLQGVNGNPVTANINFDGSTDFARGIKIDDKIVKVTGSAMIDAMDLAPPVEDDKPPPDDSNEFPPELPPEPAIQIVNMELEGIDSGDAGVRFMAEVIHHTNPEFVDYDALMKDPNHSDWQKVTDLYKTMRAKETSQFNEKAVIAQWEDSVKSAVSNATGVVIALMKTSGSRIEKTLAGDIKKRINIQKKFECGAITPDIEILKRHWHWTQSLAKTMRETKKVPSWLM